MSRAAYLWRKLTPKQREDLMAWRKHQGLPWHRPPHRDSEKIRYHVTAACFEHAPFIGHSRERMEIFCGTLVGVFRSRNALIHAWCVLPNHYHALIETTEILAVLADLGRMHGRLSFEWNGEENTRGRKVWCGAAERYMRNDAHFWATLNYVHKIRCIMATSHAGPSGRSPVCRSIWRKWGGRRPSASGESIQCSIMGRDGMTRYCEPDTLKRGHQAVVFPALAGLDARTP